MNQSILKSKSHKNPGWCARAIFRLAPNLWSTWNHNNQIESQRLVGSLKIPSHNTKYTIMHVGSNQSSDWNTLESITIRLDYPDPVSHQTKMPIYNGSSQSSDWKTLYTLETITIRLYYPHPISHQTKMPIYNGSNQSSDWNTLGSTAIGLDYHRTHNISLACLSSP